MSYYTSQKSKLLKDFDITARLMRECLVERYGQDFAETLSREVRREYEDLIPDVPFIEGMRARALNSFLLITAQGAEEFAPYVCMSDIALSDSLGWGLIRTQTLADGCESCDFRLKRGGDTKISSKTPEVQATIERIMKS